MADRRQRLWERGAGKRRGHHRDRAIESAQRAGRPPAPKRVGMRHREPAGGEDGPAGGGYHGMAGDDGRYRPILPQPVGPFDHGHHNQSRPRQPERAGRPLRAGHPGHLRSRGSGRLLHEGARRRGGRNERQSVQRGVQRCRDPGLGPDRSAGPHADRPSGRAAERAGPGPDRREQRHPGGGEAGIG